VFVALLLALICANVALLLFARAATRESEIVVRTALGASRGRIISQLFAEALVLGALASLIGLAAARFGLRLALQMVETKFTDGGQLPFWFRRAACTRASKQLRRAEEASASVVCGP
jgi:ABC-type antimicrobial peptide transport system permease subunit